MAIRLIATDLDGTLLRSDGTLSVRTVAALRRAAQAGVPVVPVTARPLRWLDGQPFLRDAAHVVLTNGAVVYDRRTAEVIARHALAPETLASLCERIAAAVPGAVFAVEIDDGLAMRHEPGYPLRSDLAVPGRASAELAELVSRPAVKLLVKAPDADPDELVSRVVAAAGPAAEVSSWVYGRQVRGRIPTSPATLGQPGGAGPGGLAELAPAGVTKATGLAAVAAQLGVDSAEVVAFGDMLNDLPMLAWAGHAVAVANAHPDVLAAADEVVASNDDDGVANWIMAHWEGPAASGVSPVTVAVSPVTVAGSPVAVAVERVPGAVERVPGAAAGRPPAAPASVPPSVASGLAAGSGAASPPRPSPRGGPRDAGSPRAIASLPDLASAVLVPGAVQWPGEASQTVGRSGDPGAASDAG